MSSSVRTAGGAVVFGALLALSSCSGSDPSDVAAQNSAPLPTTLSPTATAPPTTVSSTSIVTIDPNDVDSDEVLIAAVTGQLLADGAFQVTGGEAECVATGTVERIGGFRLAEVGVTAADPNGPEDDPYSALTLNELGDIVAVWSACTDVSRLVTDALLASAPGEVADDVVSCIDNSLVTGMGARFLLAALSDVAGPDPAVTDVLRVLDGCTVGAQRPDLADVDTALWPWLAVDLPGFSVTVIDTDGPDAADLAGFIEGVAAVDGIDAGTLRITDERTGEVAAAMIVASVDSRAGTLVVEDYVAGLVASAEGLEVFEFALPSGEEVLGWELETEGLVFLIWSGERIVVFATGSFEAVGVLSLYSELVPSP